MKVLVIDDDFHIQRIVEDRLKAENFEVLKASDGIEGLRLVYDFKPDVILLDIMMPTIDGHAVLHCIKKDDKIKNIPVIMMTAKRERGDVMQAAATGAADYILKPIDFRMMVKKLYEVTHAAPPKQREPQAGPVNIRAMAADLANLSFEIDAVAASAGVATDKPASRRRPTTFEIKIDTREGAAILQFTGPLHADDMETARSEIKRLIASNTSRFILDVSDLQTLDISEVMMLKDLLTQLSVNQYPQRLVETDPKRRRFLKQCNMHLDHPIYDTVEEALKSF